MDLVAGAVEEVEMVVVAVETTPHTIDESRGIRVDGMVGVVGGFHKRKRLAGPTLTSVTSPRTHAKPASRLQEGEGDRALANLG